MNALRKPAISTPSATNSLSQAKARLPEILDQLVGYFDVSERIASQLRTETLGIKDQLFIPVTNTVSENKERIEIKSLLLMWIALMFLTSV